MDRRAFLATVGGGLAVASTGCVDVGLGEGGLDDGEFDVGMTANAFRPEEYEVPVGETVVWGNSSTRGHTVTAYGSQLPAGAAFFASGDVQSTRAAREQWTSDRVGDIAPGETYEHTFETPGDHPYFCIPHERKAMTGVIVVTE